MSIADKITRAKEDYDAVYDRGWSKGNMEGISEGFEDGRKFGYDEGYDKGYEDGVAAGGGGGGASYEQGVVDGKKQHFNDMFQTMSEANSFMYGFSGIGINDDTFLPTDDVVLSGDCTCVFYRTKLTNLKKLLDDAGVAFDCSKATKLHQAFNLSTVTELPFIDASKSTSCYGMFDTATSLRKIWGIKPPELETCDVRQMFKQCRELVEIEINGTIVTSGIDFSACTKLSKASIESIIGALSTETENLSITLSKAAVNTAFETAEGLKDGADSKTWNDLVGTRYWWSINLV